MKINKNLKPTSHIFILLIIFSLLSTTIIVAGENEGFKSIIHEAENNIPTEPPVTTPLVVASRDPSGNFNPFFAGSGYDSDVVQMTQLNLLTTDRLGGIIQNAVEGEIHSYNGTDYLYKGAADTSIVFNELADTTTYTAQIRQDIRFSDGVPVTVDDIIFTYYTFLDPSYDGPNDLNSFPILGLQEYQTQTTSEVYDKYETLFEGIYAAGHDHVWTAADAWTQAQQEDVWARFNSAILTETHKIVEYVNTNYMDYAEEYTGYTPEEIIGNEGMEIMLGMVMWGFGNIDESGALVTSYTSAVFDLIGSFPTYEDFKNEILATYNWDIQAAFPSESVDWTSVFYEVKSDFIRYWGPMDPLMGGEGIPNIAGIDKIDDYTVEVTVNGFSPSAVYTILGIPVTPLHYYGDVAKYNYENNMFGFDFGDLTKQESLISMPLGAGPYMFIKFENEAVDFVANRMYYKGEPKTRKVQFVDIAADLIPSAIQQGIVDIGTVRYSSDIYEEIKSYNTNGEMTGDVITSNMTDNLGYGYIGINADTVNVAGEPATEASKNLRRTFATIFAVHRDVAIDAYYGDGASVINYPISNTSWAAPQPTDEGYQVAFSTDVNGDPIYTAEMTLEEKVAAAEAAALGFLEAAGYTVAEGMITEAPEGAKMSYEVIIPADGVGDHPAFGILTSAMVSLGNIGMGLVINDPADVSVLWDALDAGTQEMWAAAWGSSIDPDLYQVYHSSNISGQGGTDSNHYHIDDLDLDQLILDARMSEDQAYRKDLYKLCFDIIMGWGVEIPTYQRMNAIIYSTQRINISTITPDMTTFWDWQNDIELLEMNEIYYDPRILAHLPDNLISGRDWLADTEVTLTIGGDHWIEMSDSDGSVLFDMDPFKVQSGQALDMTDGTNTKTYTIVDLAVTSYDEGLETLSGTADPGELFVDGYDETNYEYLNPTADGSGNWTVTFSVVDVSARAYAYLWQYDENGNMTHNYWLIPDPIMEVLPGENQVIGEFWPPDTEITLTIDDSRETWVGESDGYGTVIFELEGFEILPEQVVVMSDETFTQIHIVANLTVDEIDQDLDTVFGTAEPLSDVEACAYLWVGQNYSSHCLTTSADGQGDWLADFSGSVDISPGAWGSAAQYDEDDDATIVNWEISADNKIFLPLIVK